jgi:hypothetical protein
MMGMPQQDGGALVAQASQFSRPSMRPIARPYAVDGSSSSLRNPMQNIGEHDTPRGIQRPNVGMFERFARPQIGALCSTSLFLYWVSNTFMDLGVPSRPSVQPLGGSRTRITRPKTPLQASQRTGFLSKRCRTS